MENTDNTKDLKDFYDEVYLRGEDSHYTKLLLAEGKVTLEKLAVLGEIDWNGKRVLDVGCGTGELAELIAKRGAVEVTGVDFSKEAIKTARSIRDHTNLGFACIDVLNVFGNFDVVVALGMLEHVADPRAFLEKFKSLLAPNGSLIITSPNWANTRGNILMALKYLCNARITLADRHYFTPVDFEKWAKELQLELSWKTVDHEWGQGQKLLKDFERRLPNIAKEIPEKISDAGIGEFLDWITHRVLPLETSTAHGGAIGVYHFKETK